MIIIAAIAGLLCLVAAHDLLLRPTIRRVALRNLTRRRGEAALVILGSALGTSIIAGALIVGDTFDHSIRDIARTDLGPVDQVVVVNNAADLATALTTTDGVAGIDGAASMSNVTAAIKAAGPEGCGEPNASVAEADLDELRALGGDSTGLTGAGATPEPGHVVINDSIAGTLGVAAGDTIELFAYGTESSYEINTVVASVGLAGSTDVFVAPGTFASLAGAADIGAEPTWLMLISLDGDVFDSTTDSGAITRILVDRLDATGMSYEFDNAKAELLEEAAAEGSEITGVFTAIGGFSVLAGVLLLVNLFVMLAEERKTSLGVLRAVGWRRGHLIRGFTLEGAVYGIIASGLGALLGIGVGWLTYKVTESIFASESFTLRLSVQPSSLLLAGLIGLVISLVVVWATSWRISRLNIIRAIKDLPEPPSQRSTRLVAIGGQLGAVAGIGLSVLGYSAESPAALMAGVPLALLALLPLLARLAGARFAPICVGATIIAWSIGVFGVFADTFTDPAITIFLLQGVLLVLGGVLITSSLGTAWSKLFGALPGARGPQTQLGLAYPVARRFRTGISLAMFSLIIFSLTFIAAMSAAFGAKADDFVTEASAGHHALLRSNPANPLSNDELLAHPDVVASTTVLRGGPDFTAAFGQGGPTDWPVSGIEASFTDLGAPSLFERDARFTSDVDAFDAVIADPSLTIVSTWFLGDDDNGAPEIGSQITMHNRAGDEHELTVVGIMQNDWVFAGTFLSANLVRDFLPSEFEPRLHYVTFRDDLDIEDAAAALDGAFIRQGLESDTFAKLIDDQVEEQRGIFNLLSGYLSLGLVIGVAGLGVVMVRAVRERRQQVGMLRAMGMPTGGIRGIFLTEGAFVALQGVVSGVALGLLSSYQLLTQSNTFEIELDYVIPVVALSIITLIPLAASAVASAIPAGRAARLPPAEALRLTD